MTGIKHLLSVCPHCFVSLGAEQFWGEKEEHRITHTTAD